MKEATRKAVDIMINTKLIVRIMFIKQNVINFLYLSNDKKY